MRRVSKESQRSGEHFAGENCYLAFFVGLLMYVHSARAPPSCERVGGKLKLARAARSIKEVSVPPIVSTSYRKDIRRRKSRCQRTRAIDDLPDRTNDEDLRSSTSESLMIASH
jgi:hypothetical protein